MMLLFKFMLHVLVWSVTKTVTNGMLSCLAENMSDIYYFAVVFSMLVLL